MAGIGVEQLALGIALEQRLVGMLAVDVHQLLAQFAQCLYRCGLAIDVAARAAVGADGAAQDAFTVHLQFSLAQPGLHFVQRTDLEGGADLGTIAADAYRAAVGTIAQHQAEGVEQDRFAGAGLAGEHAHTGRELQLQLFDDGEITDGKMPEHGGVRARENIPRRGEGGHGRAGRRCGTSAVRAGIPSRTLSPSAVWRAGRGSGRGRPGGSGAPCARPCGYARDHRLPGRS